MNPESSEFVDAPDTPEEPETPVQRRTNQVGHWAGLVLGCALVGALVGGVIVGLMRFVNGPVTATAKYDALEAARQSSAPKPDTNLLGGQDIELRYPSIFDMVGDKKPASGGYDDFYLATKGNSSRALAVSVIKLSSNRLEDDSGYKWRSTQTETYKATPLKLGEGTAVLMTKVDHKEVTLFWAHAGKDLNLALTSTDPHDNLPEMMQIIMPTVRWK